MKISYKEAVELIETADVVKINDDDKCVINTSAKDLAPELTVFWNDSYVEFQVCVQNFDNIDRNGHVLTFIDTDGIEFDLYLYKLAPIV
jgi:hypothetical protein